MTSPISGRKQPIRDLASTRRTRSRTICTIRSARERYLSNRHRSRSPPTGSRCTRRCRKGEDSRDGSPVDLTTSSSASLARRAPSEPASRWTDDHTCVAIVVAIAFGLRVFRLGTQSLWGDETISVFRAYGSIREITEAVPHEGTLPPLYYYLLHFWIPLAGDRETSVRFLSLVFGVLAIPLLYVLARRTLGRAAGIVAAMLATVSPFWIYYSQEARTYSLVTALVILAAYLLVRASDPATLSPRARGSATVLWCGYAVVAALAVASFYFAGFALAAVTLWLLVDRRKWPSLAIKCVLAQAGALVLLAPLLVYAGPSMLRESK